MRLASENIGLPVPQKRRKHMFANLETGNSTGYYIHSLICVVLMFGLGHLPAPSPITPTGMHVVGIFIGMIYGWLTVGMTWPSILGITALGFSGRMTVVQAFQSGFGNNTILLIFFIVHTQWKKPQTLLKIDVPGAEFIEGAPSTEQRAVLAVTEESSISLNGYLVEIDELPAALERLKKENPDIQLQLDVDKKAAFGVIVGIWDALTSVGIDAGEVPARIEISKSPAP